MQPSDEPDTERYVATTAAQTGVPESDERQVPKPLLTTGMPNPADVKSHYFIISLLRRFCTVLKRQLRISAEHIIVQCGYRQSNPRNRSVYVTCTSRHEHSHCRPQCSSMVDVMIVWKCHWVSLNGYSTWQLRLPLALCRV